MKKTQMIQLVNKQIQKLIFRETSYKKEMTKTYVLSNKKSNISQSLAKSSDRGLSNEKSAQ